jgi:metal-responsive CopG/Arc/MetJ family transcriptional regulator
MSPPGAAKIALSLPHDLFRQIERARKKRGKTRSALVQDALRFWLHHQDEAVLVREWEEGYRRMPETPAEVESAAATTRFAFEDEDDW